MITMADTVQSTETKHTQYECTTVSIQTQTDYSCPVTNTVLAFVKYGIDSSSGTNLHKVTVHTFTPDEINQARNLLYAECGLGKPANKVKSVQRSRASAMVTDIIEKMAELEATLPDLFLQPAGLSRLKKFGVEDLSEVTMAEQIRRLQIQMSRVQDDVMDHTDDIVDVRNTLNKQRINNDRDTSSPGTSRAASFGVNVPTSISASKKSDYLSSGVRQLSMPSLDGMFSSSVPPPSLTFGSSILLSSGASPSATMSSAPPQHSLGSSMTTNPCAPPLSKRVSLDSIQHHDGHTIPSAPPMDSVGSPGMCSPNHVLQGTPFVSPRVSPIASYMPPGRSASAPMDKCVSSVISSATTAIPSAPPMSPSVPITDNEEFPSLHIPTSVVHTGHPPGSIATQSSPNYTSLSSLFNSVRDKPDWFTKSRKGRAHKPKEGTSEAQRVGPKPTSRGTSRLVRGKSTNCIIQPSVQPVWQAYIGGCGPDITMDSMSQYLSDNKINVENIAYVFQRKHSCSFRVDYSISQHDKLFNANLWGPTITVARYFEPKSLS